MNTLFTECYGDQKPTDMNQSGCGFSNAIALEPLMDEIKKGILSASQAVIRQLRKKQVGPRKRKKTQTGKGRIAKRKTQTGKGKKKK